LTKGKVIQIGLFISLIGLISYKLTYLLKYSWNYCFFTIICTYQR